MISIIPMLFWSELGAVEPVVKANQVQQVCRALGLLAIGLAIAMPAEIHASALKADMIVLKKSKRELRLLREGRPLRVYNVALGRYPVGPKVRLGDSRTPEGTYTVDFRLGIGKSHFYRALHISYPNPEDRAHAANLGVDPGGRIMIHGLPEGWSAKELGHPGLDWTQGCIGVTNREIDEIWRLVDDGTPIRILP